PVPAGPRGGGRPLDPPQPHEEPLRLEQEQRRPPAKDLGPPSQLVARKAERFLPLALDDTIGNRRLQTRRERGRVLERSGKMLGVARNDLNRHAIPIVLAERRRRCRRPNPTSS